MASHAVTSLTPEAGGLPWFEGHVNFDYLLRTLGTSTVQRSWDIFKSPD